ncbi:hypothetical protein AB0A60_32970 [Streptomyces sp. NPDC046275]|uniref:hypothetical protein n=1 Tax=Streptomyces sp. NPDC046275 TaxID=3157201 RepID=UPI003403B6E8
MTSGENVVQETTKSVVRKTTKLRSGERLDRGAAWQHFYAPTAPSDDEWIGELSRSLSAFSVRDRDLAEIAPNFDRLIKQARALDDDLDESTILCGLRVVRVLRDKLLLDERRLMKAARQQRISWARIADASELKSRQAAERRYLQLRDDLDDVAHDNLTQAERVEVARTRRTRFSEFAWASSNAARITHLAARLNAVPDLQERADRSADAQAAYERAVNDAVYNGLPVPEPTPAPWPGRLREALRTYAAHTRATADEPASTHDAGAALPPAALNRLLHELFGLIGYATEPTVAEDHPDLAGEVKALYEKAGSAAPRPLQA